MWRKVSLMSKSETKPDVATGAYHHPPRTWFRSAMDKQLGLPYRSALAETADCRAAPLS